MYQFINPSRLFIHQKSNPSIQNTSIHAQISQYLYLLTNIANKFAENAVAIGCLLEFHIYKTGIIMVILMYLGGHIYRLTNKSKTMHSRGTVESQFLSNFLPTYVSRTCMYRTPKEKLAANCNKFKRYYHTSAFYSVWPHTNYFTTSRVVCKAAALTARHEQRTPTICARDRGGHNNLISSVNTTLQRLCRACEWANTLRIEQPTIPGAGTTRHDFGMMVYVVAPIQCAL